MSSINTGLTDNEKESLLKYFLTHCVISQVGDICKDVCPYKIEFFGTDTVNKHYGTMIMKAMDNLRNSAFGFDQ